MTVTLADPVRRIATLPHIECALARIHETDAMTVHEQCAIASIAAPPFGEAVRGAWLLQRFLEIGLADVNVDSIGNVTSISAGADRDLAPVVVAAHLDTVFPAETKLEVRETGGRVQIPGISDNARGLAAMLAIARAVKSCGIATRRTILFAGTVGEEGIGDLRGVKQLFANDSKLRRAAAFIALDGTEARRIVCRAVGSVRHRIVMRGPGGHSWADRGAPNAAHAAGCAIAALSKLRLPSHPAWSVSVGRLGGGTSINAIPEEAWFEIDLRSEDPAALDRLVADAADAIRTATRNENAHRRRGTSALQTEIIGIGLRPAGQTDPETTVVRAARAATAFIGLRPELVASSTDANVPMALGIPSISIGCGGESGGMHTIGEWYENTLGPEGVVRALLTIVATADATD
jgi:tripeptide aminopeptidase